MPELPLEIAEIVIDHRIGRVGAFVRNSAGKQVNRLVEQPGGGVIERVFDLRVRVVAHGVRQRRHFLCGFGGFPLFAQEQRPLVPDAEIEMVKLQRRLRERFRLVILPQMAQNCDVQMAAFVMLRVAGERTLNQFQRSLEFFARCGDLRQREIAAVLPCAVPDAFEKGVERLVKLPLHFQAKAEIVIWLAVVWIRIALRQRLDGAAEIGFAVLKLPVPQQPEAKRIVIANVARIALQRFFIVRGRIVGRVAVLLQMQPGQIELLGRREFLRRQRRFRGLWKRLCFRRFRLIRDQRHARFRCHGDAQRFGAFVC